MQISPHNVLHTCKTSHMSTGLPGPCAFMPVISVSTAAQVWWWKALCRVEALGCVLPASMDRAVRTCHVTGADMA